MHDFVRRLLLAVALVAAGCQKKAEAPVASAPATPAVSGESRAGGAALVPEKERSSHFAAVQRHLELGGTLYGYADIDGNLEVLAGQLQQVLGGLGTTEPAAGIVSRQDLTGLVKLLGLTDAKALGLSSVADGSGFYRNRLFVYTGGERHGLLAALGGKPGPWKHVGLAPADASFYGESEMDLGILYRTIQDVVVKVAGQPARDEINAALQKAGESLAISLLDLIYGLKGRSAIVLRVEPSRTMRLPGAQPLVIPAVSLLACIENIGPIIEPALARSSEFRRSEAGSLHVYEPAKPLPFDGIQPAIVVDGSMLYFTTSVAFLNECRAQKEGLAQTAAFKEAIARVGTEGNGLTYVSPNFLGRFKEIEKLNPNLPAPTRSMLQYIASQLPTSDRALVAMRTHTDDGILVRSYLNRSMKQDLVAVGIYNPVTIGLVAAMAIPAFQKVRMASQDKAILNNLRQLSAAADQHYLETGTRSATYDQLVGPDKYVRALIPVAGEDYRTLRFQQGQPLRVRLPDGRSLQYPLR